MRAALILCDFAQVSEGKLTVVGGGWDRKGATAPMGVGILIHVPWTQTNQPHHWSLRLVHADGEAVEIDTPEGTQTIKMDGDFELGRPPGMPAGSELPIALAMNVGPIPLPPDSAFEWRLEIDGTPDDQWRASFRTHPA